MLEVKHRQDKWIVREPRLTGFDRMTREHWCYNQWGDGWGYWFISDVDYSTKLVFYRKSHAEWYALRWAS